jgi:hypothetical protein
MKVIRVVCTTIEGINGKYQEDSSFQTNFKLISSFNTHFNIEKFKLKLPKTAEKCSIFNKKIFYKNTKM